MTRAIFAFLLLPLCFYQYVITYSLKIEICKCLNCCYVIQNFFLLLVIVYHHRDAHVISAVRYAANRIIESKSPINTRYRMKGKSQAINYYKTMTGQGRSRQSRADGTPTMPTLVFREVATNFDNVFSTGEERKNLNVSPI